MVNYNFQKAENRFIRQFIQLPFAYIDWLIWRLNRWFNTANLSIDRKPVQQKLLSLTAIYLPLQDNYKSNLVGILRSTDSYKIVLVYEGLFAGKISCMHVAYIMFCAINQSQRWLIQWKRVRHNQKMLDKRWGSENHSKKQEVMSCNITKSLNFQQAGSFQLGEQVGGRAKQF